MNLRINSSGFTLYLLIGVLCIVWLFNVLGYHAESFITLLLVTTGIAVFFQIVQKIKSNSKIILQCIKI
jgi:membrane-bound ClpP family serine protease